jgi:hypothetical protein
MKMVYSAKQSSDKELCKSIEVGSKKKPSYEDD